MSTLSSSLLSWPSSAGLIFSAISKSYFAMYLLMLIAILLGPRFCKILTSCLSYLMPYKSVPSAMKIMIRSLMKLLRKSSSICLYFSLIWANYFLVCGSRAWIGFRRLARSNKGFSTLSSLIEAFFSSSLIYLNEIGAYRTFCLRSMNLWSATDLLLFLKLSFLPRTRFFVFYDSLLMALSGG